MKVPKELHDASRTAMRRAVFLYQDGVVLCATARGMQEVGLLEPSLADGGSLSELYPQITPSGFGYLRVGARCFASAGWLAEGPTMDPETTVMRWTETGRMAARHVDRYVALGGFLADFSSTAPDAWSRPWDRSRTDAFLELLDLACERWRLDIGLPGRLRAIMTTHLDAAMAVPTMLWLRATGRLDDAGPLLDDDAAGRGMRRLLTALGWIEGGSGRWTVGGRQALAFVVHFGIVGSYLPMLGQMPALYRGTTTVAPDPQSAAGEWHVNRALNVDASAAAHGRYFADADGIFLELFDREPVHRQPRFVADTGCGDGSWLAHIYDVVRKRTLRGRHLASDPLPMVAIDCNAAALDRARETLDAAGVPALLIVGDVTNPAQIGSRLADHALAMEDGLHVRAFLDHNREYLGSAGPTAVPGWSSGAYLDGRGHALDGAEVERDLVAHLRRWAPHVRTHGLVVLEAHCVAPRVAREHLGDVSNVAFDAYHGYSHQYPIEYAAFMRCCRDASLQPASHSECRYPSSRPFVAVSVNRLMTAEPEAALPAVVRDGPRDDTWRPDPDIDLVDGESLHELLFAGGDLRCPRMWCSAPTGFVVAGTLAAIERRLARAGEGDVIRVLDYGAGTGLATVELLKACRERAIERRLERRRATLEIHLVDLPTSWFAQGFELLRDCAWTRFHSLRGADGGFRRLKEVTANRPMDAVMANMVFHLIPPPALQRAAKSIAAVLTPEGRLLWSSPDLAPSGPYAVLFHDCNRALRARWLELLGQDHSQELLSLRDDGRAGGGRSTALLAARSARKSLDSAAEHDAVARAGRRILSTPQKTGDVVAALGKHLAGEIELRTYEMLDEEILEALLVPSNQREYLPELEDPVRRGQVIRELMLSEVLPAMHERPASTALGLNLQWTLGSFTKYHSARPAARPTAQEVRESDN